jgi:hypothetical protein
VIFSFVEDMETIAIHVLIRRKAAFFERLPLAGDGISKNEKKTNDDCVGNFFNHWAHET